MRLGLGLAVAGALLSAATITWGGGLHDEGLNLQAAERIAAGELPYRDFWWNYGPGQPLLLAGLNAIFGSSLLTWRILRVLIDVAVALLAWRLALRHASPRVALLAWLAAAAAMAWPPSPAPTAPATALALGALLAAPGRPMLAGALAGAAAIFRPELGAAAALAAALAAERPRALLAAAAGVALAGLAPFIALSPGRWWDETIGFYGIQDLQRLPLVGDIEWGDPNKVLEGLFAVILLAAAAWAAFTAIRERRWAVLPLLLAGMAYLAGRADEFHLVPLAVFAAVALAWDARAISVVLLAVIALHGLERRAGQLIHPPTQRVIDVDVADGVQAPDPEVLAALVDDVRDRTRPGEPIFVANPRYDRVRVGNPLIYVLAQRPNPTRYDVVQPGLTTTAQVQREIVSALADVRLVVRWLAPTAYADEGSGADEVRGARHLDDFIARTYRVVARHGDYEVMMRP
jgi:hypothetical protein